MAATVELAQEMNAVATSLLAELYAKQREDRRAFMEEMDAMSPEEAAPRANEGLRAPLRHSAVGPRESVVMLNAPTFPIQRWTWSLREAPDVSPQALALGLLLATYADTSTGLLRPSVEQLRMLTVNDKSPVGEKTVDRRRRELVRRGWITLVTRGQGRGHASVYRLSWPAHVTRFPDPPVTRFRQRAT